jgi:hypothetical protein
LGGAGGNGGTSPAGQAGRGGFGGEDGALGYGGGGGGFGGGIFVRSGRLMLNQVRFEHNAAIAAKPLEQIAGTERAIAQGKGGAIFILPDASLDGEQNDTTVDPDLPPPSVFVLGDRPVFINNVATHAGGQQNDNDDIYGKLSFLRGSLAAEPTP